MRSDIGDHGLDPLLPETAEHQLEGVICQLLLVGWAVAAQFDSVDRAVQPGFSSPDRLTEQNL